MNYYFDTSYNSFSKRARIYLRKNLYVLLQQIISKEVSRTTTISSGVTYNHFIKTLSSAIKEHFHLMKKSPLYEKEIRHINQEFPLTGKTVWGGIAYKKFDIHKNLIQKLLVVNPHATLGFEIHTKKYEKIKILEGVCIVLYSNHRDSDWKPGRITVSIGTPGDKFFFYPKDEHGIITLTSCVIKEISTNDLDDLTYIFKAMQPQQLLQYP